MQKEKHRRFVVEEIAEKKEDKRTPDEKKFYTWHLKFKLPFFKQYPYEQLRVLIDKFSLHQEGPIKVSQSNHIKSNYVLGQNADQNYAFFPIYSSENSI